MQTIPTIKILKWHFKIKYSFKKKMLISYNKNKLPNSCSCILDSNTVD